MRYGYRANYSPAVRDLLANHGPELVAAIELLRSGACSVPVAGGRLR